ncbi:hypothetical protein GW750_08315 [bacterium]|nr:hypothetical protein [bacterium]
MVVPQSEKAEELEPIEFFYLETPSIPASFFPLQLFGIYDRVTIEQKRQARLKEDIIKILAEEKKFGIWTEVS